MIYTVYWKDGSAARYRGFGRYPMKRATDNEYVTKISAANNNVLGNKLMIMKTTGNLKDDLSSGYNTLVSDLKRAGYDNEEIQGFTQDNDGWNTFTSCNLDNIDGGDPWVFKITRGGTVIFEDYSGDDEDENVEEGEDEDEEDW